MKNWKTAVAGVATILGALATLSLDFVNGSVSGDKLTAQISAIAAGAGLIFAKDFNVTGA